MPKTIMIVDDEEDIRNSVKTLLEKKGYKTILAINGEDCLKKMKTDKPDLILLDIMMPGIPIKEVVKKIQDTKIAFFSVVRTTEAEKEELLKDGKIVGFIQKPFEVKDFLVKIKKYA